jgi:hypothetical protein
VISFHSPALAPTLHISIRDPEFQDQQNLTTNVRIFTMASGAVRTTKNPTTVRLVLNFREVSRSKAVEIRDFIVASSGAKLRYDDYKGASWVGYIVTEPNEITTYARGLGNAEPRKEANSFSLTFEGITLG